MARKAATSWVGSFWMKPTVSVNSAQCPAGSSTRRVVGSRVAKSWLATNTSERARRLSRVDLPGVGIAHQGHDRDLRALALRAVAHPVGAHFFQFLLQLGNALADLAPVHFQLGFAGAAQANAARAAGAPAAAAGLAGQVGPGAGQAGQAVFILRQFHLQHAFAGLGVLGEDIQDQRGAVDDVHVGPQALFQLAQVARGQLVVERSPPGPASLQPAL